MEVLRMLSFTRTANPQPNRHRGHTVRLAAASLFLLGGSLAMGQVNAQGADIFKGADLALGQKLMADSQCVACHIRKVGGDGSKMYKPQGRINNAGLLRGMVEMCNTTMNLGLFPEEVTAVAAVLNRDHYKFK
jgi:mono/diheme cytochrome c family protein